MLLGLIPVDSDDEQKKAAVKAKRNEYKAHLDRFKQEPKKVEPTGVKNPLAKNPLATKSSKKEPNVREDSKFGFNSWWRRCFRYKSLRYVSFFLKYSSKKCLFPKYNEQNIMIYLIEAFFANFFFIND